MRDAINFLLVAAGLIVPTYAQFHELTALNQLKTQMRQEEISNRVSDNAFGNAMTVATMEMQATEKKAAIAYAIANGEAVDVNGEPIEPPPDAGIRPLDPRTPTNFGDPFAREANVEQKFAELLGNLTEAELLLLEALETAIEEGTEVETFDDMIFVHGEKRHMCGVTLGDAAITCGPTCDPEVSPFCVMNPLVSDALTDVKLAGEWKTFGLCQEETVCATLPDPADSTLEDSDGDCTPYKLNNPCPNDCDCFRQRKKISKCHALCAQTDNVSILQCTRMKKQGNQRRRSRVAKALDMAKGPCEYNIYFQHPLQNSDQLQLKQLPAFETF